MDSSFAELRDANVYRVEHEEIKDDKTHFHASDAALAEKLSQ